MMENQILLSIRQLKLYFPVRSGILFKQAKGYIKAVDDISFDIYEGETLGLVGESGCGKTTTGRAILQLYRPTAGEVIFRGTNLVKQSASEIRKARRSMQMIFQDPYASLNPQMRVSEIIARPLRIHKIVSSRAEEQEKVKELLNMVGLQPSYRDRYPHEFSGGQRQRIGIARALATQPDFIVCDEPISALDVSIQAQVINLLEKLQEDLKLTYLFIAHDLSMVRYLSSRVAVMYLGKMMELTSSEDLYQKPMHPYTRALLSAVPIADPPVERQRKRILLQGDVPSPANPPVGCNFSTRCPQVMDICRTVDPEFREISSGHWCACHLV
jgi:oligopeptide transport system ATP-binding protein